MKTIKYFQNRGPLGVLNKIEKCWVVGLKFLIIRFSVVKKNAVDMKENTN